VEHAKKPCTKKIKGGRNNNHSKFNTKTYTKEEWWGFDADEKAKINQSRLKANKSSAKKRKISKTRRLDAAADAREVAKADAQAEAKADIQVEARAEARADEARADEARADEARADEARADEARADEARADEARADEAAKAQSANNFDTVAYKKKSKPTLSSVSYERRLTDLSIMELDPDAEGWEGRSELDSLEARIQSLN
jgi:hypothetical protein